MTTVWKKTAVADAADPVGYVLAPHVSLVLADDGAARLLNMGGGFFALPTIGAQLIQATLERGTQAAVREISLRYKIGAERVQKDLDALLQQLMQHKLLRCDGQSSLDVGLCVAHILIPCLLAIRAFSFGRPRTLVMLTLTKLALLCFGWGRIVTVYERCLSQAAPLQGVPADSQAARTIDKAVQQMASGHLLPMACKERALACWALLRWAGVPANLVVGLEFFPLMGHCWCEAGTLVLSDYSDNCDLFIPVLRYA